MKTGGAPESVSILVLMEVALKEGINMEQLTFSQVSILVLMEVALKGNSGDFYIVLYQGVSILVLMEVALKVSIPGIILHRRCGFQSLF